MDREPRSIAAACLGALLVTGATASAAQSMFKCKDERGRVTYSNVACEKQGLKDAGAIADRTTTLPMAPAQNAPSPASKPAPAAAKDDPEAGAIKAPAEHKPVSPLIERLLK